MHRFGCVVLVDPRGWVLLQERDEHPVIDPEKWALCGGHLEDGEPFLDGALRELAEETGVELAPKDLELFGEFEVYHEAYDSHDRLALFAAATTLGDDDIVLGEGRRIVFVEPAVVRTLDLGGSAKMLVPAFLESDLYRRLCA